MGLREDEKVSREIDQQAKEQMDRAFIDKGEFQLWVKKYKMYAEVDKKRSFARGKGFKRR